MTRERFWTAEALDQLEQCAGDFQTEHPEGTVAQFLAYYRQQSLGGVFNVEDTVAALRTVITVREPGIGGEPFSDVSNAIRRIVRRQRGLLERND